MLAYRGTMDQTPSARRPGRQRQNTAYSASSTCPRPAGARRERGTGRTTSWPERRRVLGKCPLFNSTSRKNKAISFLRLAPWFTMEKKKRGRLPCSKALRRWRSLSVAVCSGRSVAEANGTPLATAPFITPPLPRSRISRQASRSIKKQGEKWRQCSDSFQMSRVSCEDRPILLKNEFLAVPKSLLRFAARTW